MSDGPQLDAVGEPRNGAGSALRRRLHFALGVVFTAIGALGVVLPILPTTPFLLLASYGFARSSPRLQAWLRRSPVFGKFLDDWDRARGVRRHVKVVAIAMVVAAVGLALGRGELGPWWQVLLVVLALVGIGVVLRLRTIDPRADAQVLPKPRESARAPTKPERERV